MSHNIHHLSGDAALQLALRQAVLAGQHTIKQVGLLVVGFDFMDTFSVDLARVPAFSNSVWTRTKSILRDSDTVVHLDRGEMAILLSSVNGTDDVTMVAKKIVTKLRESILLDGLRVEVRPKIGIALFPEHTSNATALMQCAFSALETARRKKNEYALYSLGNNSGHRGPLTMTQLRQAIVADELFLLYQPKLNLPQQRVAGLEVLTRWRHPELGLIAPDEFIPVAERTGLIIPLTLWVLHQSLLQSRGWHDLGIDTNIAVNLSMWNLDAQELPDQINSLLQNTGVKPDKLELEITETAIMSDPQRAIRTLSLIRDLGVRFTIDDFGTGYSSLSYLKKLPVANIKIDKSFVHKMDVDKDNAVIVRSIIDLGHNLGLKVIAEGVERQEEQEMLRMFDCDEVQGFYYSCPITADAMTTLLKTRSIEKSNQNILQGAGKQKLKQLGAQNGSDWKFERLV